MPVIRVEMFKRTQEQKRNLARELTEAFVNTCGGNKEAIKILITEVDKNDWASGGIITADKEIYLFAYSVKSLILFKSF
jgi:4-oxalocrotonate tautomerase